MTRKEYERLCEILLDGIYRNTSGISLAASPFKREKVLKEHGIEEKMVNLFSMPLHPGLACVRRESDGKMLVCIRRDRNSVWLDGLGHVHSADGPPPRARGYALSIPEELIFKMLVLGSTPF